VIRLRSRRPTDPARANERWFLGPVAVVEAALAAAAAANPMTAGLLIAAFAAVTAAVVAPAVILASAFPGTFAYWRVGPAAAGMSVADALTIVGSLAALPYVPWSSRMLRKILVPFALYVGMLAITVAAHPSTRTATELGHRVLLVVGSLVIGSAIANLGRTRLALRFLFIVAGLVSVAAIVDTLSRHLAPAYPFGIQKNASGALLASCLLMAVTVGNRLELSRRWSIVLYGLIAVGFMASQSRGTMLALLAVLLVFATRHGRGRLKRWAPVLLVVTVVLLGVAAATYTERDLAAKDPKFSSLNTRVDNYTYALDNQFVPHPIVGAGMKWFKISDSTGNGPHNFVIAELSETGILGLFGLLIFLGVMLNTLRKSPHAMSEAAYLVVLERILDSLLGIFWVAGTGTLPFLVVGLAVGEEARRPAAVRRQLLPAG
jgi:O-antigen ligase